MRVITLRETIKSVPARWRAQYEKTPGVWDTCQGTSSRDFYDALCALDLATATSEDIEAIVGNTSWTRLQCDECDA